MAPNSSSAEAEVAAHIKETGILDEDEAFPDLKESDYYAGNTVDQGEIAFKPKIAWFNTICLGVLHLFAAYGLYLSFQASWATLAFAFLCHAIAGLGITAGAHRYFSHRAFKAKLPLHLLLLFCITVANQASAYTLARDHRMHHKYTETNADPYNTKRGMFYAHVGWLLQKKHPAVLEKSKQFKHEDLLNDPWVCYQHKYFHLLAITFGVMMPTFIPWYFWGESLKVAFFVCFALRTFLTCHITWSVNSIAHKYGFRPYNKEIYPADNAVLSFFAAGEGWHNYHHMFPYDYRASEAGIGMNVTTSVIDLMAKLGLAYDLRSPSPAIVRACAAKKGDGSRRLAFPDEFGNYPADGKQG